MTRFFSTVSVFWTTCQSLTTLEKNTLRKSILTSLKIKKNMLKNKSLFWRNTCVTQEESVCVIKLLIKRLRQYVIQIKRTPFRAAKKYSGKYWFCENSKKKELVDVNKDLIMLFLCFKFVLLLIIEKKIYNIFWNNL